MIIKENKSHLEGVKKLHYHLYDADDSVSNHELADIYEEIDSEVGELEESLYEANQREDMFSEQVDVIKNDIQNILDDWENRDKDEIFQDLERILF